MCKRDKHVSFLHYVVISPEVEIRKHTLVCPIIDTLRDILMLFKRNKEVGLQAYRVQERQLSLSSLCSYFP